MYSSSRLRRSWVDISLSQIRKNYNIYKSSLPEDTEIMAVVKADAYGHGDIPVCTTLYAEGVRHFAVSNIDEAMFLRSSGIGGEILILGYTPPEYADLLLANNITQALLSERYASRLAESGLSVRCQFAVDTGMNRIGLSALHPDECERIIRKYADILELDGIFTHLCAADTLLDEEVEFTRGQIASFAEIADRISDLRLPNIHCLNSAGGMLRINECPAQLRKLVRLGIVMYGLKPDDSLTLPEETEPALTWKTTVAMIKNVPCGESIGYGRAYTAERDMTVATLPTGYADGYSRHLSNVGYVLVNGCRAPIVGRICMDQMMVDVSGIPGISEGDEAVLIGRSGDELLTADMLAKLSGTIGYEIVCGISKRVPRNYI